MITARDAAEALATVSDQSVDLVLSDVKMPGIDGLELVRQLREVAPDLPCIVVTGYGSPDQSVEALRAGAFWYLEKPFDQGHLDVVRRLVAQAIEVGRLRSENRMLQRQLCSRYGFDNIVGTSSALREVLEVVAKVAETNSTVLITGESGTGKELIARALHYNSPRTDRMFVTVNCGAIPEELLESELFGHVKGAFTNAVNHREGRFSVADGGTLFLDEIGDMPLDAQAKLLRVLQTREVTPVGGTTVERVDVRILTATHRDLRALQKEEKFREDLFARVNEYQVRIPTLRERKEDIHLLFDTFLRKHGRSDLAPTFRFMTALTYYDWPYNVRELEACAKRAIALTRANVLDVSDLPPDIEEAMGSYGAHAAQQESLPEDLQSPAGRPPEGELRQLLQQHRGNVAAVGRHFGKARMQVHRWLRNYGIEPGDYRGRV